MTKAQALAMVNALEANKVGCEAVLRFDGTGIPIYTISLDATQVYTGAQLGALANYCASNGLSLNATFSQLGVI